MGRPASSGPASGGRLPQRRSSASRCRVGPADAAEYLLAGLGADQVDVSASVLVAPVEPVLHPLGHAGQACSSLLTVAAVGIAGKSDLVVGCRARDGSNAAAGSPSAPTLRPGTRRLQSSTPDRSSPGTEVIYGWSRWSGGDFGRSRAALLVWLLYLAAVPKSGPMPSFGVQPVRGRSSRQPSLASDARWRSEYCRPRRTRQPT